MRRLALLLLGAALVLALAVPAAATGVKMAPPTRGDHRPCLDCHRLPNLNTNEGVAAANNLCMECHGQSRCQRQDKTGAVSLQVNPKDFGDRPHAYVACLQCHADVARSPHRSRTGATCRACHHPHGEGDFGDPHLTVRCQACHHKSAQVRLDPATGLVVLARRDAAGKPIRLADHRPADYQGDDFCLRCHTPGNQVGAPSTALPAKSLLCFMCHTASISLGSWWQAAAMAVFLAGLVLLVRLWLLGKVDEEGESLHHKLAWGSERVLGTVFSRRHLGAILKVVIFDVILQRRLLQESVQRWFFHTLIYWSILARCLLGVFTWLVWQAAPEGSLAGALIDKNQGFVALFHDLTGLLMLLGVILSALQRVVWRPKHVDTSATDAVALALLAVIALAGFATEAARIMLGQLPPDQAAYAFVGYPLSRLWAALGGDWTGAFTWLWYVHGLAAAALVAWLPFGKLRHILTAPLSLIMNRHLD